jgi:hypothetical protein
MTNVLVQKKVLGSGLSALLITLDGTEGMTLPALAEVLGVDIDSLRSHCDRHNLIKTAISSFNQKELRARGVIPMRGRSPHFLPKETIKELVRHVGTPEAKAIYSQLWEVAEAVQQGDLIKASTIVGIEYDDMLDNLEKATAIARKAIADRKIETARADEAERTKSWIGSKREATAMSTAAKATTEANRAKAEVILLQERLGEADNWKTAAGWIVELKLDARELTFGRRVAAFSRLKNIEIKTSPHSQYGSVNVYSREAVLAYLKS